MDRFRKTDGKITDNQITAISRDIKKKVGCKIDIDYLQELVKITYNAENIEKIVFYAEEIAKKIASKIPEQKNSSVNKAIEMIKNTKMKASPSNPAFSRCIGNHCQGINHHKNITIAENNFIGGNQENVNSAALSFINMNNVCVNNNLCEKYGRFAKVYRQNYTYLNDGSKRDALDNEGICNYIKFYQNKIDKSCWHYKKLQDLHRRKAY